VVSYLSCCCSFLSLYIWELGVVLLLTAQQSAEDGRGDIPTDLVYTGILVDCVAFALFYKFADLKRVFCSVEFHLYSQSEYSTSVHCIGCMVGADSLPS